MHNKSNKALVLLSGGLDSSVVLSICSRKKYQIYAISFDYGQRHKIELENARWQANYFNCKYMRYSKFNFMEVLRSQIILKCPKIDL